MHFLTIVNEPIFCLYLSRGLGVLFWKLAELIYGMPILGKLVHFCDNISIAIRYLSLKSIVPSFLDSRVDNIR